MTHTTESTPNAEKIAAGLTNPLPLAPDQDGDSILVHELSRPIWAPRPTREEILVRALRADLRRILSRLRGEG